jgi:hypothetical protein
LEAQAAIANAVTATLQLERSFLSCIHDKKTGVRLLGVAWAIRARGTSRKINDNAIIQFLNEEYPIIVLSGSRLKNLMWRCKVQQALRPAVR